MPLSYSLLPALAFALRAHAYALPNPQAAAAVTPGPSNVISADLADITDFSSLPQSYYDAFTSQLGDYSIDSAQLASESAAYASYTKEFYATAAPSVLAAISSYDRAESSAYAAWTSGLNETIGTSEYNALTSEYAQFTKEAAIYATYTGTGIPPGISGVAVNSANASRAEITSDGVVVDNPAVTATGSASGPAQESFAPLTLSQSAPAEYALTCLDSSSSTLGSHDIVSSACSTTAEALCETLTEADKIWTNRWVWSEKGQGCAMGYWLPVLAGGAPAAIPSAEECSANIYDQMARTCFGDGARWNAASVNLAVAPTADTSGQQVNAGKMTFLIAGSPYPCGPEGCLTAGSAHD